MWSPSTGGAPWSIRELPAKPEKMFLKLERSPARPKRRPSKDRSEPLDFTGNPVDAAVRSLFSGSVRRKLIFGIRLLLCLFSDLVIRGVEPGAALFINDSACVKKQFSWLCSDQDACCTAQYSIMTVAISVSNALACVVSAPALVFFDDVGARGVAVTGGVAAILGQCLLNVAIVASGQPKLGVMSFYGGCILSCCGAQLVQFVVLGFIWHFDRALRWVTILCACIFQLRGSMEVVGYGTIQLSPTDEPYYHLYGMILCTVMLTFCTPSRREAEEMRAEVLNMDSFQTKTWVGSAAPQALPTLKTDIIGTNRYNLQTMINHALLCFAVMLTTSWAMLYKCYAGEFGSDLLIDISVAGLNGSDFSPQLDEKDVRHMFAYMVTAIMSVTGAVLVFLIQTFWTRFGFFSILFMMLIVQLLAYHTMHRRDLKGQMMTAACAGFTSSAAYTLVIKYAFELVARQQRNRKEELLHRAGGHDAAWISTHLQKASIVMIFFLLSSTAGTVILVVLGVIIASEKGEQNTLIWLTSVATFYMLFFYVYCIYHALPKKLVLPPQEEAELCRRFGCECFADVMYITRKDSGKALIQDLSISDDPVAHARLVLCVDPDRMEEKLHKRSAKEIVEMVMPNAIWHTESKRWRVWHGLPDNPCVVSFWRKATGMHNAERTACIAQTTSTQDRHGANARGDFATAKASAWRSLHARPHTKELAEIIRHGDRHVLELWLMHKGVEDIRNALWELTKWDENIDEVLGVAYPASRKHVIDMFASILSLQDMASLMFNSRAVLKPAVIDYIKADLIRTQREIARRSESPAQPERDVADH